MIVKLALLGAVGFVGYKLMQRTQATPEIRLAGGPLSRHAVLQRSPDQPPANDPYRDQAG